MNRLSSRAGTMLLKTAGILLVAASWISSALFAVYIVGFYLGNVPGHMAAWNSSLPKLYEEGTPHATWVMGVHLFTGAVLLLLGPIQLFAGIRDRFRVWHRWTGRLYVLAGFLTGLAGLSFVLMKGTVGGLPMDIGFGLYGALTTLAAVQTYRHAAGRRFDIHRRWAIRLYALAIGSWLYRMDYGFWLMLAGRVGHTETFEGWFDIVMAFFFYVPNLAMAEIYIRGLNKITRPVLQMLAALLLFVAVALIAVGTYYFMIFYWWPGITHQPIKG